ncbi:AraC family transcriptional regulator [Planotetraspora phitsanulokensis]|uniref:Transcriptional regulator n=1 Tax=Planotetraspora phitsanulokensis TaxID=575192 RepID=A0A8J3XCN8_9ACTN|nr:AraC family transcriptional regulator [Planotetraspora phitsanulokensis]GII36352.1 transcriptional regulator [Planotetraspora phitsanulokensis]
MRDTTSEPPARPDSPASGILAEAPGDDCRTAFQRLRVTVLSRPTTVAPVQRYGGIGPLTFGDAVHGVDLRVEGSELRAGYHVLLPIAGHVESRHRGVDVVATRDTAVVYRPEGETTLTRWAGDCRLVCVGFGRAALERSLEALLGHRATSQIAFAPSLDMTTGRARSWARMLLMLNHQLGDADSVVLQPLVAPPLVDGFIRGFLLAADHPYRERLDAPAEAGRPAVIRTAIDIMEAEPQTPLTISMLAARCHVSARTLQEGFQRHVGVPPMTYLRNVRLRRAHDDLCAADPSVQTVASIARSWGFAHLGRFAALHQAEYGVSPAWVLRSSR